MISRSQEPLVVPLSQLDTGAEAVCYALLVDKSSKTTRQNKPFWSCTFKDRQCERKAAIWSDSPLFADVEDWEVNTPYRLRARLDTNDQYGPQILISAARMALPSDASEGFDLAQLIPKTHFEIDDLWDRIQKNIDQYIEDDHLKQLVRLVLDEHAEEFRRLQAATSMHHAYTGGLLEHVWSMTRLAVFIARHYAREYYPHLDPPLNVSLVVAATILHDIGKLLEYRYGLAQASYTTPGRLVGHVVMGRDMVRAAAAKIKGFPEHTLLLLEHALLAHHGKREFGAPIVPMTLEAFLVSSIDDLDAKVGQIVEALQNPEGEGDFTSKVFGLEGRRFYRGKPAQKAQAAS